MHDQRTTSTEVYLSFRGHIENWAFSTTNYSKMFFLNASQSGFCRGGVFFPLPLSIFIAYFYELRSDVVIKSYYILVHGIYLNVDTEV